jgi:hypothetical protein
VTTIWAAQTDGEVSEFAEVIGVPLLVSIIGLIATVGVAALSFAFTRWSDSAARRRDGYAAATRELVAWAEYCYRIRRRTSNDPATLAALTEIGHQCQEALRFRETWISSENRWAGTVFNEVREALASTVGAACAEAWQADPITDPKAMSLGGWGPIGVDEQLRRFERAVAFRFGWRRIAAFFRWHPGA